MGKKGVTYIELVKINLDKARSDAKKIGSTFVPKESFSKAAAQWKRVKEGKDSLYTQKSSSSKKNLHVNAFYPVIKAHRPKLDRDILTLEHIKEINTITAKDIDKPTIVRES